ncbi:unnamed protein product, partial [Coregonus sp. 'balchen']
ADGVGDWRVKEARDLSNLVQNRITYLQLHHVVYCFMIAYGTQRTLILESYNWRYATGGWETVFHPISNSCTDRTGVSIGHWS